MAEKVPNPVQTIKKQGKTPKEFFSESPNRKNSDSVAPRRSSACAPADHALSPPPVDFMMGGVSAAVAKTAAAPIERIKLLVQNQGEMLKTGRLDRPYSGIVDCARRTYADEGMVSCAFLPQIVRMQAPETQN